MNNKLIFLITCILMTSFALFSQSIDKKIGQMLIFGFDGNTPQNAQKAIKQIKTGEISGVIIHGKNIGTKDEFKTLTNTLVNSNKLTPFIAIDNEGGFIQRYRYENYKSAHEIGTLSIETARQEYKKMAELEKELNINLNFAPCVDLAIEPKSIINRDKRSYGTNPKAVSQFAKVFIEEHNNRNIATSIKHFPGHGSAKGDTHSIQVDSTASFIKEELIPYRNLKNIKNLNMVMISHIYNKQFDKIYPASLSENTIKNLLIKEIGFNGVIISDDYNMDAIRHYYSLRDVIVYSINSGINILLFANTDKYKDTTPQKIHNIIKRELLLGNIKMKDINNSYNKVVELKKHL